MAEEGKGPPRSPMEILHADEHTSIFFGLSMSPLTKPNSPAVSASTSPRMSFAFSSFGNTPGSHIPPGFQSSSFFPSSHEDHSRPASYRRESSGNRDNAQELTPREVVDLARSTSYGHARSRSQSSPSQSPGGYGGRRGSTRPWEASLTQDDQEDYEPVEFVPLEDEVLLPFETRGAEIKELMEEDRNKGLFGLLKLAFPAAASSSASEAEQEKPEESTKKNPKEWSFPTLVKYLTEVERESVSDRTWVDNIREAVEWRSEPLWEKLKGLLGVDEGDFDELTTASYSLDGGRADQGERDVWIEGLEPSDEFEDEAHSSGSVKTVELPEEGIVGGGLFSPERASVSLPATNPASSPSSFMMESIGEDEEEGPTSTLPSVPAASDDPALQSTPTTPPRGKDLKLPPFSTGSPERQGSGDGVKTPVAEEDHREFSLNRVETIKDIRRQAPSSHGRSASLSSDGSETKDRKRSFVGVSIVSAQPAVDTGSAFGSPQAGSIDNAHRRSLSSFSSSSFSSHTGAGSLRGSLSRGTGFAHTGGDGFGWDDTHSVGPLGVEEEDKWDPRNERGPGNPLFPTSFVRSLCLDKCILGEHWLS